MYSSILVIEELSAEDRLVVKWARRLELFLTQPFFQTQEFTGRSGRHVPLAGTIAACRAVVEGRADGLPEEAFFMVRGLAGVA